MAKSTKAKPAKYTDKSQGQPELAEVFTKVRGLVAQYQKGSFAAKSDDAGRYELYVNKEVEVAGRKMPELAFCSVLLQKGYVGFYLFPIYISPELKNSLPQNLIAVLKGKTCFHVNKFSSATEKDINEALNTCYNFYKSNGWI